MVIAANASVGKPWAHHATAILAGLLAGAVFLFGVFDMTVAGSVHNPLAVDIAIMVTGLAAAGLASKPVRERAARLIPIDPDNPVHSLALVLGVILLGTQVASLAFTNVLAADLQLPPLNIGDLLAQEVPFLVIAFAGVGLWVRRGVAGSADRLGLVVPAWWHVALALAAAGVFFGIGQLSGYLSQTLTPGISQQVDQSSQHLFGDLSGGLVGIIALALVPGICEEILFRGALQPRFGLALTAVLFTAIHTEYGLSIDVLSIFVIALGLGAIRKYTNTTTSIACHVTYNLLVGLSLGGAMLVAGVVVEIALVAVVGYVLWARRRPSNEQAVAENAAVR
jgi:membrane protease YdiL (CAAX protease family)